MEPKLIYKCVCIYIYIYISLSLSLSICLSVCLSIYLSLYLCLYLRFNPEPGTQTQDVSVLEAHEPRLLEILELLTLGLGSRV